MFRCKFLKLFLILMSALVLNQCVDEIEFQPLIAFNEIGNFNDLNSAVEYISEVVMGRKDLFPEYTKDGRHKQSSCFKHIISKILDRQHLLIPPTAEIIISSFTYPLDEKYTFLFSREFIQPPNAQC